MSTCYIGIGSNLGDRRAHIQRALELLSGSAGVKVLKVSSLLETRPLGGPPGQGMYLNGVAEIETAIGPRALLNTLKRVERSIGRPATSIRWGPRLIDLDILLYGKERVDEPDLKIPHPEMRNRDFVLRPIAEIAPRALADWETENGKRESGGKRR